MVDALLSLLFFGVLVVLLFILSAALAFAFLLLILAMDRFLTRYLHHRQ